MFFYELYASHEKIDGPQSVVFDQAENRLHIQKAIMLFLGEKFEFQTNLK